MNKKINVGLIGVGRIGKLHAENIVKGLCDYATLKSIADIYYENAEELAEKLNVKNVYKDYRNILEDKEIDVVIICSPTDTHAQIIIDAANNKKDVFCEKPIDLNIDRIKEVLKVVDKNSVKLQIGFNRRFDPNFKKIHDMVKAGSVGNVHIIKISSRDPAPPPISYIKGSGGLFLDMSVHDFDMCRFLSGSEALEIFAIGGNFIDPSIGEAGDIDTASITIKMKNNVICMIDNSRKSVYGYDQRVEVFGSKGCLIADNNIPTNVKYYNETSISGDKPYYFFMDRYKDAYLKELESFFECIINGKEPLVTGKDGLESVYIAMAANSSLKNKNFVKIDRK